MNKAKLKSLMVLHGDTNLSLSAELGVSAQRFSMKINESHGAEFTQNEISIIKQKYKLTGDELAEIFFDEKVS